MSLAQIRSRIKKAQGNTNAGEALGIVAAAISRKAYYDEMTEEEKNAYCAYIGSDREAMETVEEGVTGTLHFIVERKPKPLTEAQFRERVREVEEIVNSFQEEYAREQGATI